MLVVGYIAFIIMGIILGVMGAGGSALSVPIITYFFEVPASLAITYGLFVVGITSLFGSIKYLKLRLINFKKSFYFILFSLLSIYLVRVYLLNKIPSELFFYGKSLTKDSILICIFAFIIMLSAFSMIKNTQFNNYPKKYENVALSVMGSVVGIITGLVGAGGGFLIVPTLTIFSRLKFKEAIGTSLILITCNSLFGFGTDIFLNKISIEYDFLIIISLVSIIGALIGSKINSFIEVSIIKKALIILLLLISSYIFIIEIVLNLALN